MKSEKRDFEKAFIFAVLFATLACVSIGTVSAAQTHYVNPGESIQTAVDNANAGDTIIVRAGTYTENVDVNVNRLTLKSENGYDSTIVQAAKTSDHVIKVKGDYVTITGFTVTGATGDYKGGIRLYWSDHCNIADNNASNNYRGIYLDSSNYNSLSNNIVKGNSDDGIHLSYSSNNSLANNAAEYNGYGIFLSSSSNYNSLTGNTANFNNRYGILLSSSSNNNLTNNTAMENERQDLHISASSDSHCNNAIENMTGSGNRPIGYYNSSVSLSDVTLSELILCNADHSNINNVTIAGSSTKNNNGVLLKRTDHSNLTNINSSNNDHGICLYSSSNNSLTDNTANSNNDHGIYLYSSSNNSLTDNTASNNDDGIYLYSSSNNSLTDNTASNNDYGIWLYSSSNNSLTDNTASNNDHGIWLYSSSNNSLANNTAEDNDHGIYLYSSSNNSLTDNTASNNDDGIYLSSSSNNSLTDNTASNNDDGIWLSSSSNNSLTDNTASNNDYGIWLISSSNNSLANNTAEDNNYGIWLYSSSNNNSLMDNTAEDNNYGIWLSSSSNNLIYNNYFNNTNNADDDGNNTWNITKTAGTNIIGGAYIGGNYWSDYAGEDLNGDGLGDTQIPYIPSGNIKYNGDYLPLVQVSASSGFDTGAGTYPSIQGTHEGKIIPSCDIEVSKMYTYPCAGTGGHTKSIKLYENGVLKTNGNWSGYQEDWQNITITPTVTLKAGHEYRYVIETGSYPQIIHVPEYQAVTGGTITCDRFTDENGRTYDNWIPAIRLE